MRDVCLALLYPEGEITRHDGFKFRTPHVLVAAGWVDLVKGCGSDGERACLFSLFHVKGDGYGILAPGYAMARRASFARNWTHGRCFHEMTRDGGCRSEELGYTRFRGGRRGRCWGLKLVMSLRCRRMKTGFGTFLCTLQGASEHGRYMSFSASIRTVSHSLRAPSPCMMMQLAFPR